MGTWSCSLCTLDNDKKSPQCSACGAQNPLLVVKPRKLLLLPKAITKPIEDISNAVLDIFSYPKNDPVPAHPPSGVPPYPHPYPSAPFPPPPQQPPPRPAPPRPQLPTTSQGSSLNYSVSWVCKQCYKVNELPVNQCSSCGCSRALGAKRRRTRRTGKGEPGEVGALCSEVMEQVEQIDAIDAATSYNRIIQTCREQNIPFIDECFPHSIKSIGNLKRSSTDAVVGELPMDFIWLRPQQVFTKDGRSFVWSVFRDPQPSDIEQGVLGDCWLLSAMALIAERPDVLEHIILTKEYTSVGAYQIRLCVDGEWKVTLVDDFFPCRAKNRALAFAIGRKNQLWVPLIEKALAKQLGSYSALTGGRTLEGLATLTGAPCEQLLLENSRDDPHQGDCTWVKLLSSREAGFVMGCSCGSGARVVNREVYLAKGLLTQHAYSILDVRQEGVHRLIRLRNPWGSFVWNGDWSDHWLHWDPVLKKRLLGGEYQSGSFWMSFSDFIEHFDSVDIAKLRSHAGWTELRTPIQMGRVEGEWDSSVRFFVEHSTELCFTLFQSGSRTCEDKVDLMVSVHRFIQDSKIGESVCRSPRRVEAFTSTGDVFLEGGEYVVICHSLITLGAKKINGCLAIHSSRQIYADIIPCTPAMYTDSLIQMCLKEGKEHTSLPGVIPRYVTSGFAGLMLMVDNILDNRWVHVNTDCTRSENLVSSRGALHVTDVVPPMSRQIIIVLTHFEPSASFLVEHRLTVMQSRQAVLPGGGQHFPVFSTNVQSHLHLPKSLFS